MRRTEPLISILVAILLLAPACGGSTKAGPKSPALGQGQAAQGGGAAAAPAAPPKKITSVEGITEYQLDNGMRVLLFPDSSQATVTVNVTYFVGSRHEGYGEAGMAHLLEHMVFKGTPSRPAIFKLLQERGANFNGTTWVDRTNYYETLPASGDNLEWALALEADRMINSTISPEDLSSEFSVVRNEFEMGENSPVAVLTGRMESTAFLWHNYGQSTIGNKSDIERVQAHRLRDFYEKYYQPDNAMLVVSGRFDQEKALAAINEHFGAIPRPERELEKTYTVEPMQDGEREVILRRVGEVPVVGLLYHAVPGSHEDFVAFEALAHLLTDEPSGRLYKKLVEEGLATRVWARIYPWKEPSVFEVFAQVPPDGKPQRVRDVMIQALEEMSDVKPAEVQRFKNRTIKQIELGMTDSQRIAVELSEWAAMGDWRLYFLHRDRVEKLEAKRVQKVAQNYLRRSNRTLGMFLPTKSPKRAPQPDQPDVASLVEGYKGREAISAGERFEATITNVESRTERLSLENGMKVALLSKETRGDAVQAVLTIHYGSEKALRGKETAAAMLPRMLMRGTKKRSYQEIQDELDRLKAQVRFGGSGLTGGSTDATTATITTVRDNLPEVIALVGEIYREPSFPKEEFEIIKKEQLANLEEQSHEPLARGFTELFRALSPWPKGNVRYVPTMEEQIERTKRVRLADLRRLHARHWGANRAELAIVGDFDPAAAKKAAKEHFATWKAKRPYERIATPYRKGKKIDEVIETPDKKNAVVAAGHTVKMKDDHPDYPAVEMAGYILAGGGHSRVFQRLREKEGLSYGAFGGLFAGSLDDSGVIFAAAICAPNNADKAMKLLLEEIEKLVEGGVSEDELEKAKGAYLERFKNQLSDDGFLASSLRKNLFLDRKLTFRAELNEKIRGLKVSDVNAALEKYFAPEQLAKVKAGDLGQGDESAKDQGGD